MLSSRSNVFIMSRKLSLSTTEYGLMSLTVNRVIEAVITFALVELWVSFGWNKSCISVGVFVLAVLAVLASSSPVCFPMPSHQVSVEICCSTGVLYRNFTVLAYSDAFLFSTPFFK